MWLKIKTYLRKVKACTIDKLINTIAQAINAITKSEIFLWFEFRGYSI